MRENPVNTASPNHLPPAPDDYPSVPTTYSLLQRSGADKGYSGDRPITGTVSLACG